MTELAVTLAPTDPQARTANAYQLEKVFDIASFASALKEHERAVALSPNNYFAWLVLGQARERDGDRPGAETAFRQALSLAPEYARARWALGNNLVRQGKIDEGFEHIRAAVASDPSFAAPAVNAAILTFGDDIEGVIRALDGNSFAIAELARSLADQKRLDDALAAWRRIPVQFRKNQLRDVGKGLMWKFIGQRKFRPAAELARETATDPSKAPNIGSITNGGFEGGVAVQNTEAFDWQIGTGVYPQIALFDRQPKEGRYCLAILFNVPTNREFRIISNTAPVEPQKRYELSFGYKNEVNTRAEFRWRVVSADGGAELALTEPLRPSTDWAEAKVSFTVPQNTDGISIQLARDNCNSALCTLNGNIFFDDFRLKAID